jgi:hypothetical protein
MKTYNVIFKSNNCKSTEHFFAKAYAKSINEIKKEIGGRLSPFYGYHVTHIFISSVDYDFNSFKTIPGFEQNENN